MLLVARKREFTFPVEDKDEDGNIVKYSYTFRFPFKEEQQVSQNIRDRITKGEAVETMTAQYSYSMLRQALVAWDGIAWDDTKELIPINDKDGNLIEMNQLIVFETVAHDAGLFKKVRDAFEGIQVKN